MATAHAETAHREDVGRRIAALFDQHGRLVLGICRVLLRDPHEAEDAAQQTFLSAYRALLSGTQPLDARRWLAAIARNECRARVKRRPATPAPVDEDVAANGAGDVADIAASREQLLELKAAVSALPNRQRQAVLLRDFHGLSYDEVAAALSVTPPAVEALLVRARTRVRQLVKRAPAAAVLPLPTSLRDQLARSIPGFEGPAAEAIAAGGGAAAAGLVAKLAIGAAALGIGVAGAPKLERLLDRSPVATDAVVSPATARSAGRSATGPGTAPVDHSRARSAPAAHERPGRHGSSSGPGSDDARAGEQRAGHSPARSSGPGPSASGTSGSAPSGSGASASEAGSDSSGSGSSGPSAESSAGDSSGTGSGAFTASESRGGSDDDSPTSAVVSTAPTGSGSSGPSASSGSGGSGSSGPGSSDSGSSEPSSSGPSPSSGSSGSGSSGSGSSGSGSSGSGSSDEPDDD